MSGHLLASPIVAIPPSSQLWTSFLHQDFKSLLSLLDHSAEEWSSVDFTTVLHSSFPFQVWYFL
ncbi:hypothetical protein NC651_027575 [Populus alba x Populus x berolinensis]|nr:hypothetical protein NC651_027575 [Populus alba x Populus x berolinensis]